MSSDSTIDNDVQNLLTPGQTIPFTYEGQTYQTWYTTTTSPAPGSPSSRPPLVILHGGPGSTHHYLLALLPLAKTYGIPLIFYDQVGNGLSTHFRDVPAFTSTPTSTSSTSDSTSPEPKLWTPNPKLTEFLTPELFMCELDNLLTHLNLKNQNPSSPFSLYGQSWGGMLASQYVISRQPSNLQHLILSNAPSSIPLFSLTASSLISKMPEGIQETVKRNVEKGTTQSVEFQGAAVEVYKRHMCRLDPWPKEFVQTLGFLGEDPDVYYTM